MESQIIQTILQHYPTVQGIYLFGSYAAGNAWSDFGAGAILLAVFFGVSFNYKDRI